MAELNFPDPTDSPTYEQAGIVWTWSETLEAWISDGNDGFTETDGDGRYLRKDATAGAQTVETTNKTTFSGPVDFSGQTTHANGISVTGGDLTADAKITSDATNRIVIGNNTSYLGTGYSAHEPLVAVVSAFDNATNLYGLHLVANPTGLNTGQILTNFRSVITSDTGAGDIQLIKAQVNATQAGVGVVLKGIQSQVNNGSAPNGEAYNVYANGDAPSYFNGGIQFDLTHSQGGTQDQLQLDDYEEGTFTVACDNAATDSMTKDGLSFYRVIGKTIVYAVRIGTNSDGDVTLPAGSYAITGFPFTNVGANSGGVVTFAGGSTADRGRTLGSLVIKSAGYVGLEFTLDSPINNVRMIRCTVTAVLRD